ncbi:DNA-binding IclR family transcriptional regulator [Agromyces flavus]|uniref:DNA-binding IclR family transcriptional regulator n=1 Tax=Agromyces flavus TaxID=589382 RepID=A0A1H1YYC2_9MICO|nr:helix-turn-helix domain-containing protein [Agromyces flavus]MCP2366854.1 DNA-binding IclR family transcriptional regulator [Agromyces flavus]GGI46889.1 transcriptional regulator [Agromyces flavus]SDT26555.1 DNA-binding transcriptional regulator, IclR family [Agromyces flavus]
MTAPATPSGGAGSQTLSRGIRALEILADADRNLSIDEVAAGLGVHRSVAYRLLRTLEDHGLVARDAAGRLTLGTGLAALASGVARDLQQVALPELSEVANEFGMTCLLAVLVDTEEAVTLVSAAPRQTTAVVSYRPGHRHPITRGGPGKAILLSLPESAWPTDVSPELRAEMAESRARGYTLSRDEVVPSLRSVAVPLTLPGQPPAAIAVIHVSLPRPESEIAERLQAAARTVSRSYGA